MPCLRMRRLTARLLVGRSQWLPPCTRSLWLVIDNFDYTARLGASAHRVTCHAAHRRLLRLRRASGCLGTSRGLSSTSSPTPRVRVPQHVARLVVWLVVDYFTSRRLVRRASRCLDTSRGSSCGSSLTTSTTSRIRVPRHVARLVTRLVVDYFDYTACPGASARRVARRRLLRLHRASGCLSTSRDSSCGSSSTTSPRAGSDAVSLGASARRAARCVARRRLLRLAQARTPRVLVRRHDARLVVDYFDYAARPGASARRAARQAARRASRRRLL
jgi:hypothetical protein